MNTDFSWVEMKKENGKVTKCIPDFHSRRCLPKMKGRTKFCNCCGVPRRREPSPKMPPSTMPNTSLSGWKEWGWGSSMEASVVWEFFRVERKWVLFERMV